MNEYHGKIEFTLLYDGLCSICAREISWLFYKDKHGRLGFEDISRPDFDPARYGKTLAELMAEMHGVYPDGRLVKGMTVFRVAYRAVGLGWLLAPTGWPLLKPLFDMLYRLFAKYRPRLFRRLTSDDEPCNCGK